MAQTKIEQGLLKFTEATDYLKIPTGTTAQRPSSPVAGYIRFNTTISAVETYDGTEWVEIGLTPPTFSSVDYPGSATALDPAGGESLVINGTNFNVGITVTIGGTTPSSITRNSENQLTVTAPAKTAGTYNIVFTNTDGGTATAINAVSYNGIPAFTNAAGSLASVKSGATINVSAAATEPDGGAITYAITSGALPSGSSLNTSTGAITGTAPSVDASTTSNFTVTATDNENQSTARAYSITVTPPLPSDKFKIVLYTGNGGTQSITGVGFQPDFVWIKDRGADGYHAVHDSTRGATKGVFTNVNNAEYTGLVTSLDTDGFTVNHTKDGSDNNTTNRNGGDFVAWCWKANGGTTSSNTDGGITSAVQANTDVGFSIATYTGSGSTTTIGHGLSSAPEMIIVKSTSDDYEWKIWHKDLSSGYQLLFNSAAQANDSSVWTTTAPTSTVFSIGTNVGVNGGSKNYVAYAFKSIDGFSKIGSYTGTGSTTNRPIVETGFEPAFVMIKNASSSGSWMIHDNKRNTTNPRINYLRADYNYQDGVYAEYGLDFFSNGFQVGPTANGSWNSSGHTFIYMAFAEDPDTTAPTLADSFNAVTYTGTGSSQAITGLGFAPNLVWVKQRGGTTWHNIQDTINGATKHLYTNATNAQDTTADGLTSFDSDGFTLGGGNGFNGSSQNMVAWAWKADDNEPTIKEAAEDIDAKAIYTLESNANDVTGNYNATASGITYSSGKFGNAATYSGTNASSGSKIYVSNNIYGSSTSTFTVSLWIKCTNTSGEIPIAGNGGTIGGTQGYAMYLNSGSVALTFRSSNGNQDLYYGSSINDNAWHHLVLTFNNGPYALYLDGELELSGTTTNFLNNTTPSFDTYFGNRWNRNEAGVIAGQIDQIRIYDKPLSAASITNLYNETTAQNSTLDIGTQVIVFQSIVSANANAGFSIVKYKGNGVAGTKVPHGLSAAPELIIAKNLQNTTAWGVYVKYNVGSSNNPASERLTLQTSDATTTTTVYWGGTEPTSSVFTVGTENAVNQSGYNTIAYCFHSVAGYSKIGSYSGGSTGSGNVITTGFQPDWIMIKRTDTADDWTIIDSVRGDGASSKRIIVNTSEVEKSAISIWFPTSTGFYFSGTGASYNSSGGTYIYAAFKIN